MIKLAFFVARHRELNADQFRDHALEIYVPLLKKLPGLKKLVINFRVPVEGLGQLGMDAMAELWFDSLSSYQQAVASPEGEVVRKDRTGFFDETRSQWVIVEEMEMKLR